MKASLDDVLGVLRQQRGIDLRDYRRAPIARGLDERLRATGSANIDEYLARLQALAADGAAADVGHDVEHEHELDLLLRSMLVSVTAFFRDPDLWTRLLDDVLPALVQGRGGWLRAWVPGCATGEDAWSLALVLEHVIEQATVSPARPRRWSVLGSDLDSAALAVARARDYDAAGLTAIPPALRPLLDDQRLHSRVTFERHDLLGPTAAPAAGVVADFDVVLCRNVLIYFDRRLRRRALERLAGVLRPGGLLILGLVEQVPPELAGALEPVPGTAPHRLYRRMA